MSRPIHAEIRLAAFGRNYAVAKRAAPGSRVLAVVKANAYGHGIARVARALPQADGFATLELDGAVRLREQGFTDLVEGTVYALLTRIEQRGFVDVEKVPSEKGPPRKVYTLNALGREQLDEFWRTWSFLSEHIGQLRTELTEGDN